MSKTAPRGFSIDFSIDVSIDDVCPTKLRLLGLLANGKAKPSQGKLGNDSRFSVSEERFLAFQSLGMIPSF